MVEVHQVGGPFDGRRVEIEAGLPSFMMGGFVYYKNTIFDRIYHTSDYTSEKAIVRLMNLHAKTPRLSYGCEQSSKWLASVKQHNPGIDFNDDYVMDIVDVSWKILETPDSQFLQEKLKKLKYNVPE